MTEPRDSRGAAGPMLAAIIIAIAFLTMFLQGCTVGPNFARPDLDLPKDFGVAQSPSPADEKWWTLFQDPVLDRLVTEALAANHDLRAAAERIEQARAQVAIARSDMWPDAGIDASSSRSRATQLGSIPLPPDAIVTNDHRLVLRFSWELDFWGKYRRATEAARAELLASEAGRDAVRASLIGEVVRGYFALQALDRRLEVAQRTLLGRDKALELQKLRFDAGVVSELEYRQVESDLRTTQALVPVLRQVARAPGRRARGALRPHAARSVRGARRSRRRSRRSRSRFPRACPRTCCCAAPTCARPRRGCTPPTRASASRAPRTFPRSRSPATTAARANRSAISSAGRRAPGTSPAGCCSRSSPRARSRAASTSPTRARAKPPRSTRRRSRTLSARCATRSRRNPTCAKHSARSRSASARSGARSSSRGCATTTAP